MKIFILHDTFKFSIFSNFLLTYVHYIYYHLLEQNYWI